EAVLSFAEQQHPFEVPHVFDEVVGDAVEVERIMHPETALDAGLIDQRDLVAHLLESRCDCSKSVAATWSMLSRRRARRVPASIIARSACAVVSRSSTSSTGSLAACRSSSARARADFASGPSEPSMRRG